MISKAQKAIDPVCQGTVGSARGWSLDLPVDGHVFCPVMAMGSAHGGCGHHEGPFSGQGRHPLPGEGLGQADGLAGGLADVGVVQEPVDRGRGEGLGHQLVEGRRVEVGGQRDRAFLVRGIDQAVEALGGVGGNGQQPDVVELCRYPHSLTYADTATMPRSLPVGPDGRASFDLRLGIVTGSRGTRAPCRAGGSGRAGLLQGW